MERYEKSLKEETSQYIINLFESIYNRCGELGFQHPHSYTYTNEDSIVFRWILDERLKIYQTVELYADGKGVASRSTPQRSYHEDVDNSEFVENLETYLKYDRT